MTPTLKRNNPSSHRLATYLAAGVGAALGVPHAADASVVVTNGPESTGIGGIVEIDFDGDGTPEFAIEHSQGTTAYGSKTFNSLWLRSAPGASNQQFLAARGCGSCSVARLSSSYAIPPSLTSGNEWVEFGVDRSLLAGRHSSLAYGHFADQEGFIGVRFTLPGAGGTPEDKFGWIYLHAELGAGGTVIQYAYETDGGPIHSQLMSSTSEIPEPNSLLLLATGAAGLLALRRRRNRKQQG